MNYTSEEVIRKLHDLYFIQRKHYLIQSKDRYAQYRKGELLASGKKVTGLLDWHFYKHLEGVFTIGTFAEGFSKFITFDLDYDEPFAAKIMAYRIADTLDSLKFYDYHISYSGKKGYHIEIFIEDLISVEDAKKFFDFILKKAEIEKNESGKVEFRPNMKLGIKIPLGIHKDTENYCGFCTVEKGLDNVMNIAESQSYLMRIQRINSQKIYDVLEAEDEFLSKGEQFKEVTAAFTPLQNHNQDLDYSVDLAIERMHNGLVAQGTRHNTVFLLSMYMKYQGLEKEEAEAAMIEWMEKQDKQKYTSSWNECIRDIKQCIKDVYSKGYALRESYKDISVNFEEINWILENCKDKNAKVIAYAFLIHSKRHKDAKGNFFFTFKNIAESTGVTVMTAKTQVNKLIAAGVIEAIERNRRQKGNGLKNLPNIYKVNYQAKAESEEKEPYKVVQLFDLKNCLRFFYTNKELRKTMPRKQYESFFKVG